MLLDVQRSPLHTGALGLLSELRAAENRGPAAEALLSRIARLDPNNLAATQALALRLFLRGALFEDERHDRNAVRIAVLHRAIARSDGMIMWCFTNRRYARMASYATPQVTEQLYDRSRYRNYRDELAPVIPILGPAIARLTESHPRDAAEFTRYPRCR